MFDKKAYASLFKKALAEKRIRKSRETFKIRLFLQKAENSLPRTSPRGHTGITGP
ncbi:hypothetical protein ACFL1B_06255 [Nanoarchaeota archaeon]